MQATGKVVKVSMATLSAATTRHCHADGVSGILTKSKCFPNERVGGVGTESMAKLEHKAKQVTAHGWNSKHVMRPQMDSNMHDCYGMPLTSIGLSLTLSKLHLATYTVIILLLCQVYKIIFFNY